MLKLQRKLKQNKKKSFAQEFDYSSFNVKLTIMGQKPKVVFCNYSETIFENLMKLRKDT